MDNFKVRPSQPNALHAEEKRVYKPITFRV